MCRRPSRLVRALSRRPASLAALALFVAGTNFCVFAPPPSLAAATVSKAAAGHGCCGAAREKGARNADATRQATAPCCVAVSPVVAGHGAVVSPAPELAALPVVLPVEPEPALVALLPLALAEDARPPARDAATPDAGRAPPRL